MAVSADSAGLADEDEVAEDRWWRFEPRLRPDADVVPEVSAALRPNEVVKLSSSRLLRPRDLAEARWLLL